MRAVSRPTSCRGDRPVRALDRKLLRDLRRMRGQVLSIAAVVACGVASVVAMGSTLLTIDHTREAYYSRTHFADVFASLTRAPEFVADRVREIPGVAAVTTRVTASALLRVPGLATPATGYFVSVDPRVSSLNRLHLRRGRMVVPDRSDEVLVDEHFTDANRLAVGDSLGAVINGRWRTLHVVGIAISPEFVHAAAPGFAQFGDPRHFGVLWMDRAALARLRDLDGAFNELALALAPGANEQEVVARVDALLGRYGGGHAYPRADQPSEQVVSGEIEQLRAFGVVMPIIFLAVAAFLINVVLSRLVATQRGEIATLKAFGYGNGAVAAHFVGYAIAAVVAGAAMGIPLGAWIGSGFTGLYKNFFRFPEFTHHTDASLAALGVGVSALAAVVGALTAVHAAAALPPAEGMRPPSPSVYRPLLLERLGFAELLPASVRMVLRTIEHRPVRTLTAILGVALSAAVLVAGIFAFDSARYIGDLQFRLVQREDLAVGFTLPMPARVSHELAAIAGVRTVEPFRGVPVRVRSGHRSRQIAILGLEQDASLRRLVDMEARRYRLPPSGLVLTASLGRTLHVVAGDTVVVELLERGGAARSIPVAALIDEVIGVSGYMRLAELNRLVGEGAVASGALLTLEPGAEADALDALGRIPGVSSVSSRRGMLESFEETLSANITMTTTIVTILACVIAVGVLYNGARIALSERGRELASLRVLGFTRREVAALLFGEQGGINALGTPLGLLLGLGLAYVIASAFGSELYRFPVIVTARTYAVAIGVIVAASLVAGFAMRRRLYSLDMVEVLKTRE